MLSADGEQLLLSRNFADGKTAGSLSKLLQADEQVEVRVEALSFSVWIGGIAVADSPQFADAARDVAIDALRVALTPVQE
jgi:tryptophanyl-tRNA synthetase